MNELGERGTEKEGEKERNEEEEERGGGGGPAFPAKIIPTLTKSRRVQTKEEK